MPEISDMDLQTIGGKLQAMATMGDAGAKQVLVDGKSYPFAPYDAERWGPKGRFKECFRNAYRWAIKWDPELTYCEGYATGTGFPVHHAWLIDPDGNVQDPTWREPHDRACGYCLGDGDGACWNCGGSGEVDYSNSDYHESDYFGIEVPLETLCEILLASETTAILGKPWPKSGP